MLNPAEDLRLAIKSGELGRIREWTLFENFDGHLSAGGFMDGLVNNSLAAAVNFAQDTVAGNG